MKIYIRVDLEGVTGVVNYRQVIPGNPEYVVGQKMLMNDLDAAIAGAFDGGASKVLLYDMHYHGNNVLIEQLDRRVKAICGKPPLTDGFKYGMDESVNAVFFLGFHSKAGTHEGVLAHTYELETQDIIINGTSVGEIGVEAAIAGELGIPVVLVTGDSKGMEEAINLLGKVRTVSVKESISEFGACCLPPVVTSALIRKASVGAVRSLRRSKPLVFKGPITLKVVLKGKRTGRKIIRLKARDVTSAWLRYLEIRRGS
jgi:D-amino peptidase